MVALFDNDEIKAIIEERAKIENTQRNFSDYKNILGTNNGTMATIQYNYGEIIKANAMF